MTQAVKNRLKSFAWRTGMMVAAFGANYIVTNLSQVGFSPEITIVIGLIMGEVSKYLMNEIQVIEKKSKV